MALSPQWLDELRARTTLSALIGRTTKLTRAGREFKACCPFHDEKTPSFYVNDAKGFYHCFGCQAHGDAIRWLTDQQGLPFMDAVKELAASAGMEVPAPDPQAARRAEERAGLHDVTAAAQDWFVEELHGANGVAARQYLEQRCIDRNTAKEFGFGYAPDSRSALHRALARFDDAMLVETGLRIKVDDKEPYDRFRARLMLPIQDARGRVIAFGGRILDTADSKAPKYLNSPETPLFDKGSTLYNLHRAGPASRKTSRVLVVEGYMDVVALAAAGIHDAVAPLGTALTERQIERLWRLVDRPVLCFDGDAAGQRAAMKAAVRALPMLRPGQSLAFVTLPAGKDPDDVVRLGGAAAMERLLAEPRSLLDLVWETELAAGSLDSPEQKASLKARLLDHADAIEHPDIKALYRREWLERFGNYAFPPRAQRTFQPYAAGRGKIGGRWQTEAPPRPMDRAVAGKLQRALNGSRDSLGRAVVAGLLRHPDQIARHVEALARYRPPDAEMAQAIETLLDSAESLEINGDDTITLSKRLDTLPDTNARFTFLMEGQDPQAAAEDLAEAVALLVDRPALEAALAAATERFESSLEDADFAEQQRLRRLLAEFDQRLRDLARRRAADSADAGGQDIDAGDGEPETATAAGHERMD